MLKSSLDKFEKKHAQLYITYKDLDEEKVQKEYRQLKLKENISPVIIVGDSFMTSGYSPKKKEKLEENILKALNNKTIHYDKEYRKVNS